MIIPSIANIPPLFNYATFYNGPAVVDSSILNGFVAPSELNYISSFYNRYNSTWYLLGGDALGSIYSWRWTGLTWVSSPEFIEMGYVQAVTFIDFGSEATPGMFYIGNEAYMIVGDYTGLFKGYHWGSRSWHPGSYWWDEDTSIINGLVDCGAASNVCGFEMDGVAYLIVGSDTTGADYYRWTGSAWVVDNSIGVGLAALGRRGGVHYFEIGPQKFIILSSLYASVEWNGFIWNGTSWDVSTEIVSGLTKTGNVNRSTAVFNFPDGDYLILNEEGTETGYKLG